MVRRLFSLLVGSCGHGWRALALGCAPADPWHGFLCASVDYAQDAEALYGANRWDRVAETLDSEVDKHKFSRLMVSGV